MMKKIHDQLVIMTPNGFEEAKDMVVNIENLIIAANGPSKLAADYAAYIMRYLNVFNTVKVIEASEL